MSTQMTVSDLDRAALVRRGQWLRYATVGYNTLEGLASIVSGGFAGSISLVGFGIDSLIEVASGGTAMWRLRADVDEIRRERVERASLRIIGVLFLLLAAYVVIDAVKTLWGHEAPGQSIPGMVIAA